MKKLTRARQHVAQGETELESGIVTGQWGFMAAAAIRGLFALGLALIAREERERGVATDDDDGDATTGDAAGGGGNTTGEPAGGD